jgi:hypothetical protein
VRTRGARGNLKLNHTLDFTPPPPRKASADTEKNALSFFSKRISPRANQESKERFLSVFCLHVFGRWREIILDYFLTKGSP